MTILSDAAALGPGLRELRRSLHRQPELGLRLPRTQRTILDQLNGLGLEVTAGAQELTSVTAVLRGAGTGPVVLLRADMDALPLTEATGEPFSSEQPDAMHGCGHDLHVAGLVGAARLLAARRAELNGDVVFMFQPGEEGHDGAARMIEAGVLEAAGRPADAAYGLHVRSALTPRGCFGGRSGPLMAAADTFDVRVVGAGGHGSLPHASLDPIPAAAEMVVALQTMVTRTTSPFDPVVLTVGMFRAGTKHNIIPDEAVFGATVRSFTTATRQRLLADATRLCTGIAAAHGLTAEVVVNPGYPVTVNDDDEFAFAADTVVDLFGPARFEHWDAPIPGSEDFSRVLERVPGAYLFLGACATESHLDAPTNHSPRARFDDSVLPDAAALLAELAIRRMNREAAKRGSA